MHEPSSSGAATRGRSDPVSPTTLSALEAGAPSPEEDSTAAFTALESSPHSENSYAATDSAIATSRPRPLAPPESAAPAEMARTPTPLAHGPTLSEQRMQNIAMLSTLSGDVDDIIASQPDESAPGAPAKAYAVSDGKRENWKTQYFRIFTWREQDDKPLHVSGETLLQLMDQKQTLRRVAEMIEERYSTTTYIVYDALFLQFHIFYKV